MYLYKRLRVVLVFIFIFTGVIFVNLQGQDADNADEWALVERDTIQTRNLAPVINHAAMLVNLGKKEITVSIHSPLPSGKYRHDSPFTAFGNDSLLGAPMFAPFSIPTKHTDILGKPEVIVDQTGARYSWSDVKLPPEHAAMAQYDYYFGPQTVFFTDNGIDIASLQMNQTYTVEELNGNYRLRFTIDIKNAGTQDIEEMFFRLFVPQSALPEGSDKWKVLAEPVEIWSSDNLSVTESSIIDGFTRAARGIDASAPLGGIKAGTTIPVILQIDLKKKAESGIIYPIMNILGRRASTRLWPATQITGVTATSTRQFHYLFYNLVLADRYAVKLEKTGMTIIPAESLQN